METFRFATARWNKVRGSFLLLFLLMSCESEKIERSLGVTTEQSLIAEDVYYRDLVGGSAEGWYVNQYCMSNKKKWSEETQPLSSLPLGIYEVSQYPSVIATTEHELAAQSLINASWDNAVKRGWTNKQKALDDGFEPMWQDGIHYANREFLYDGVTLDPERPEFLMFYGTPKGNLLMGVMYGTTQRGEQFAGPLSVWHFHKSPSYCYEKGIYPVSDIDADGKCVKGEVKEYSVEMMHAWFFEHPQGPLATQMYLLPKDFKQAIVEVNKRYESYGLK